jgi:hypothetical protein
VVDAHWVFTSHIKAATNPKSTQANQSLAVSAQVVYKTLKLFFAPRFDLRLDTRHVEKSLSQKSSYQHTLSIRKSTSIGQQKLLPPQSISGEAFRSFARNVDVQIQETSRLWL